MTILHKLFVRVHFRYTRSPHAGELSSYSSWLIERECSLRLAQRLVFRVMRSLEACGLAPDRIWTEDELDRAFRRRRHRRLYRQARYNVAFSSNQQVGSPRVRSIIRMSSFWRHTRIFCPMSGG